MGHGDRRSGNPDQDPEARSSICALRHTKYCIDFELCLVRPGYGLRWDTHRGNAFRTKTSSVDRKLRRPTKLDAGMAARQDKRAATARRNSAAERAFFLRSCPRFYDRAT